MVEIIIPTGLCVFFWFLFLDWESFTLKMLKSTHITILTL
ncbi:hypothetical protein BAZOLSSOX_1220 [uncultured Gammaproteobacteria bacterium]|nr:hypothetical protein BAZOLSSOX_1220 [uncultured Gammaproteobacteria bacterium]